MPSRKIREPGPILYGRYHCEYGNWMEITAGEDPGHAYQTGFLPYSRESAGDWHRFYMGRSLRVNLDCYQMDKKRRYSHRQWQRFKLERSLVDKRLFMDQYGESALEMARDWMVQRFGKPYLDLHQLKAVLEKPYLNDIMTWSNEGALQAFALIIHGTWGAHYWFAFYESGESGKCLPGHGYRGDFLEWSKEKGLTHAYLGTAYGRKSRYKSRGLDGIEFWDGNRWNPNRNRLAELREQDDEALIGSGATHIADNHLV